MYSPILHPFLYSPEMLKRMQERDARDIEQRIQHAKPWHPDIKWVHDLTLQVKSFPLFSLFDVAPLPSTNINDAKRGHVVLSPQKNFVYAEKILRRGRMLRTFHGSRQGNVLFDDDIAIPSLHEVDPYRTGWRVHPWMSLTPSEMLTLRPGVKRAKGRVIVAGLGLGYQLLEVAKRKQVKEIILVEKSQELVDWILPRLQPRLEKPLTDVVVGDAKKVLRTMRADVALIDIFPDYGGNSFTEWVPAGIGNEEVPIPCPGIKSIWCWGSARVG